MHKKNVPRGKMNGGPMIWSGSEEHQNFGVRLRGVGAEPRLPRSLFCREGRRLPTTSTVISACGGKKGTDRETERVMRVLGRTHEPCPGPGSGVPWWGSVHQAPGRVVWGEVPSVSWKDCCLWGTRGPQGPQICLWRPSRPTRSSSFNARTYARRTNTDVRHHKLNKMNGYMLQF